MANVLAQSKQQMVVRLLVEGNSIRGIERITGVHRDTICRLLVKIGNKCRDFLDERMRSLKLNHLQLDEIWTFVAKKQAMLQGNEIFNRTIGDQFMYVAIDEKTKLIPTFAIGKRDSNVTRAFIRDLSDRIISENPQISTDGFIPYVGAIRESFGDEASHGVVIKDFAHDPQDQPGRYGPPRMVTSSREQMTGLVDIDPNTICTSHVERNNVNIRMFIKRFTRLTLAFSKKLDNLAAAAALYVVYHNFCWVPRKLRVTPAMAAGLTDHIWELDELLAMI
jgi:IS1 family transposase